MGDRKRGNPTTKKPRRKRSRICHGKKNYGEMQHAVWDAKHISIRDQKRVDVFVCPTCAGIHVGHAAWDHTTGTTVLARFSSGIKVAS
jgi:hypothetical protein